MKKYFFASATCLAIVLIGLVYSCKKDSTIAPSDNCPAAGAPTDIGTRTSFTEEFETVYNLATRGWVITDNTGTDNSGASAGWTQGYSGNGKGGPWYGFMAYSYTASKDEFVYSPVYTSSSSRVTVSSWLITPVLSVKNGDKISFYTRSDTTGSFSERMQVLMNKSSSDYVGTRTGSVCSFSNVLIDINPGQALNGYPTTWTKYEYTFTGLSGNTDTRIGFRHFVANTSDAKGIGIDLFKFEVN